MEEGGFWTLPFFFSVCLSFSLWSAWCTCLSKNDYTIYSVMRRAQGAQLGRSWWEVRHARFPALASGVAWDSLLHPDRPRLSFAASLTVQIGTVSAIKERQGCGNCPDQGPTLATQPLKNSILSSRQTSLELYAQLQLQLGKRKFRAAPREYGQRASLTKTKRTLRLLRISIQVTP